MVGVAMGDGNVIGMIVVGNGNGGGGAIEGKTAARLLCATLRLRWTAVAAMGNGGAMGGRTAGHPWQGREMG